MTIFMSDFPSLTGNPVETENDPEYKVLIQRERQAKTNVLRLRQKLSSYRSQRASLVSDLTHLRNIVAHLQEQTTEIKYFEDELSLLQGELDRLNKFEGR